MHRLEWVMLPLAQRIDSRLSQHGDDFDDDEEAAEAAANAALLQRLMANRKLSTPD